MERRLILTSALIIIFSMVTLGDVRGTERDEEAALLGATKKPPLDRQTQANIIFTQQMEWNAKVKRIAAGSTYFLAGIATTFATLSTQNSDPTYKNLFEWITVGAGIGVLMVQSVETCLIGPREQVIDGQIAQVLRAPAVDARQSGRLVPLPTLETIAESLSKRSE